MHGGGVDGRFEGQDEMIEMAIQMANTIADVVVAIVANASSAFVVGSCAGSFAINLLHDSRKCSRWTAPVWTANAARFQLEWQISIVLFFLIAEPRQPVVWGIR